MRDELGRALKPIGARIDVLAVDEEDARDARRFFQFEPDLCADVSSGEPGRDGALFAAVLSWARNAGADVAILLDWDLIAVLRDGTLHPATRERPFFEREVLTRWNGPVSWSR